MFMKMFKSKIEKEIKDQKKLHKEVPYGLSSSIIFVILWSESLNIRDHLKGH
jgi:hypothetical protein